MVDWLVIWGAAQAAGFIFKPILEDMAKESAKDFVKDFCKDSLKHVLLREKDPRQEAIGKAIKEFLVLVQQELELAEISETEQAQYIKPFKQFLKDKNVRQTLGEPFKTSCTKLNVGSLAESWNRLNTLSLPNDFSWKRVGKLYLIKVKAIIRESEELRGILDSEHLESIKEGIDTLAKIPTDFDLERYKESLQERYGSLKLDSLDTSGSAYNELKLWRMFVPQNVREVREVLPQIHELPKEHQKRLRESNQIEAEIKAEELEQYKRAYFQQPTRSVLEVIDNDRDFKYLVILGDPGSGKSTLLQYLALKWTELPDLNQAIPLLIELRIYMRNREEKQCQNFLDFFHQSSGSVCHINQHKLHEQLQAGNALVMFDGLDEIFDVGKREDVITDIHRFSNDYPDVKIIVTSRVIGYKPQQLRDAKFSHFMLQDLEKEQIDNFINRWHDLTFNDEADKLRIKNRLQTAIDTSSAILELAGNPLLLTMMAVLNRHQELPRDRPELYNQASRVLLHQWDVERALVADSRLDGKTIDYKDKQSMLRQVAYQMQANKQGLAGNLISDEDLEKTLTENLKTLEVSQPRTVARVTIEQLRTRNFILCFLGADCYAFVHRTFLEYFCAWEFVWRFEKSRTLSLEDLKNEVFGKHWQDESWHEVLRLIGGMVEANFVDEIIEYLIAQNGESEEFRNLFLAAGCIGEVRNRNLIDSIATKLLNRLKDLISYGSYRRASSRYDLEEATLTIKIRTQAVSAIVTTWKDNPDTLPWLKQRAQNDEDLDVRRAAIIELARGWKNDPDTLPILKQLVQRDGASVVRQVAIQELARGWKDDPGMFEFLCDRAINDPFLRQKDWEDNPRQTALGVIIEQYSNINRDEILSLLSDRQANEPDEKLREFAKAKLEELNKLN